MRYIAKWCGGELILIMEIKENWISEEYIYIYIYDGGGVDDKLKS